MNRRALIVRAFMTSVSAAVFTATGWLMGTGSLTMYQSGPTPPSDGGCLHKYAGPSWITCVGATGCSSIMCAMKCTGGILEIWWGCNNENPPCSEGYCDYEVSEGCSPDCP